MVKNLIDEAVKVRNDIFVIQSGVNILSKPFIHTPDKIVKKKLL